MVLIAITAAVNDAIAPTRHVDALEGRSPPTGLGDLK
jgi:hypothetical protein